MTWHEDPGGQDSQMPGRPITAARTTLEPGWNRSVHPFHAQGVLPSFPEQMAVAPDLASPELIASAFQGERGKPGLPGEKGEAGDPVSIGYSLHEGGDKGGWGQRQRRLRLGT